MYNKKELIDALKENEDPFKVLEQTRFAINELTQADSLLNDEIIENLKRLFKYKIDEISLEKMIVRQNINDYINEFDINSLIGVLNEVFYVDMNISKNKIDGIYNLKSKIKNINNNLEGNVSVSKNMIMLNILKESNKFMISYVGCIATDGISKVIKKVKKDV